jgi:hypothetical protein
MAVSRCDLDIYYGILEGEEEDPFAHYETDADGIIASPGRVSDDEDLKGLAELEMMEMEGEEQLSPPLQHQQELFYDEELEPEPEVDDEPESRRYYKILGGPPNTPV